MRRFILGAILALMLVVGLAAPVMAATTADVTVTATPSFISISVSPTSNDFGVVAASATPSTTTSFFTITNGSSILTDQTIAVTAASWSGGVGWTHSDTCTPGADTAGLMANKGGEWGTGDIIVKFADPNYIAEDQAANTGYSFGLKLYAPTSFGDGVQKQITVQVTAVEG